MKYVGKVGSRAWRWHILDHLNHRLARTWIRPPQWLRLWICDRFDHAVGLYDDRSTDLEEMELRNE